MNNNPDVYGGFGIHPHNAKDYNDQIHQQIIVFFFNLFNIMNYVKIKRIFLKNIALQMERLLLGVK
jgi:hypothetical protein